MSTRMRLVRQYNEQLSRKDTWKLTLGTVATAIAGSVLLDVVSPYLQAKLIGSLHLATLSGIVLPLVFYLGCVSIGSFLAPLRKKLRRLVQDKGEAGLLDRTEKLISLRPRLSRRAHRTAVMAAIEKSFSAWDQYNVVLFDQFCSVCVGFSGLCVILLFTAPVLVIPVSVMIAVTVIYAMKVGKIMSGKWSAYTRWATEEYALIADQASNSHVWWIIKVLAADRQEVDQHRSAALRIYATTMGRYQRILEFISRGFQVSSFVTGIAAVTILHIPVGDALVLIVGGMSLGSTMLGLFSINDVLSTKLTEAGVLDDMLMDTELLGPELPADTPPIIKLVGEDGKVVIHREIRDDTTGELKAKVDVPLPDMVLAPAVSEDPGKPGNLWWIKGPKGCGKTSLSEAICGLHDFDGSLTVGGFSVRDYSMQKYVINGPQSFDSMDRPAKMLFGGDEPNEEVLKRVLHWVGYPDAPVDRPLNAYSGGQRESLFRAGLFYAACQEANNNPDAFGVLLIDEPTNHLDPESIEAMLDGIRELAYQLPNRLVLVNSHCTDMVKVVPAQNIVNLGKEEM